MERVEKCVVPERFHTVRSNLVQIDPYVHSNLTLLTKILS